MVVVEGLSNVQREVPYMTAVWTAPAMSSATHATLAPIVMILRIDVRQDVPLSSLIHCQSFVMMPLRLHATGVS